VGLGWVHLDPEKVTDYCSPGGLEVMRKLADELRARAA
jgi:hypothetical protein